MAVPPPSNTDHVVQGPQDLEAILHVSEEEGEKELEAFISSSVVIVVVQGTNPVVVVVPAGYTQQALTTGVRTLDALVPFIKQGVATNATIVVAVGDDDMR